jgi:hypothetical protein
MGIEAKKSLGSMALKVYSERVLNLYSVSIISCQTHIITVIKSLFLFLLFSFLGKIYSEIFEKMSCGVAGFDGLVTGCQAVCWSSSLSLRLIVEYANFLRF